MGVHSLTLRYPGGVKMISSSFLRLQCYGGIVICTVEVHKVTNQTLII